MAPTVFDLLADPSAPGHAQATAAAVSALRAGNVVLLPTETVYGLSAGTAFAERLVQLKGRPRHQPLTLHLGDPTHAEQHGILGPRARRLAERFWPGPLTMVLPAKSGDGTVGLRVPAHPVTAEILRSVGGAWMTSANRSGAPPLEDPAAIADAFGEELAVVLSERSGSENAPGALASTVLWCVGPDFKILRQGSLGRDELLRTAARTVLFVCTGNTCRSPLAAALAQRIVGQALSLAEGPSGDSGEGLADLLLARGLHIGSAGVAAVPGFPASDGSLRAAAEIDLDLGAHGSSALDVEAIASASRIYCLSASHRDRIVQAVPEAAPKVELLRPDGQDIADPFGGDLPIYRAARDEIAAAVEARKDDLIAEIEP